MKCLAENLKKKLRNCAIRLFCFCFYFVLLLLLFVLVFFFVVFSLILLLLISPSPSDDNFCKDRKTNKLLEGPQVLGRNFAVETNAEFAIKIEPCREKSCLRGFPTRSDTNRAV